MVRVLIVDDSPLLRRGMRLILEGAGLTVVGECAGGREAVALASQLDPDAITMDLDMPGVDGLAAIERIMADHPTPILVVTGDPHYRGLDGHFEALTRGAIDLVVKPGNAASASRLVERLRAVARVDVSLPVGGTGELRRRRDTPTAPIMPITAARRVHPSPVGIVAVGASTGGPGALRVVLGGLGRDLPVPVVVVQHMAEEFAGGFVRWLRSQVQMPVVEATPGMRAVAGTAHVAVRGMHLRVTSEGMFVSHAGEPDPHRPSVDVMFQSVATSYGKRGLGVLLTGMGNDGAIGMSAISNAGGLTIAQDEDSSVVFGMPGAAIARGAARLVLSLDTVARVTKDACRIPPGGAS